MVATAFDQSDKSFDIDQYKFMDLEVSDIRQMKPSVGLECKRQGTHGDSSRNFKIIGKNPDSYKIQVISK